MRVVFAVHQFFPRHTAGTEVLTYETARALQARGHHVHVITAEPVQPEREDAEFDDGYEGIPVCRVPWSKGKDLDRVINHYYNPLAYHQARQLFRRLRPDIVHVYHLHRLSAALVKAAKECGAKVVFTATDFWTICPTSLLRRHDDSLCSGPDWAQANCLKCLTRYRSGTLASLLRRLPTTLLGSLLTLGRLPAARLNQSGRMLNSFLKRRRSMRRMFRSCDLILAPSAIMYDMLARNGVPAQNLIRLAYGHNTSYLEAAGVKTLSPWLRFAYTGQIAEHKGVHVLVEAFQQLTARMPSRPASLQIWGDLTLERAYTDRLRRLAANHPGIVFRGPYANPEVGRVFREIDALVVPSLWYENAPLVIANASAAHTPVIASDMPGMTELVRHDINGLRFRRGDVADLGRQLRRLLVEPGLLDRLRQGIGRVKNLTEFAVELEHLYRRCLSPGLPALSDPRENHDAAAACQLGLEVCPDDENARAA